MVTKWSDTKDLLDESKKIIFVLVSHHLNMWISSSKFTPLFSLTKRISCSEQRRATYRAVYIKETNSHCDEEEILLLCSKNADWFPQNLFVKWFLFLFTKKVKGWKVRLSRYTINHKRNAKAEHQRSVTSPMRLRFITFSLKSNFEVA